MSYVSFNNRKKAPTRKYFNRFSEDYESQDRYKYKFNKWMTDTIIRQVGEKGTVLDMGTGNGAIGLRIALKHPKTKVIGIDLSSGMIDEAKKKAKLFDIRNISFVVSTMGKMNIRKADIVVSSSAFHHVKNKKSVVSGVFKILPKGGKLVIGDWFRTTKGYRKSIQVMNRKNPKRAKEFISSFKQLIRDISKEYKANHPQEYPVSDVEIKGIFRSSGFRKTRIVKCPLEEFFVIIGEK